MSDFLNMDFVENKLIPVFNLGCTPISEDPYLCNPSKISYIPHSQIIKCMNCDFHFYNKEFSQHICDYDSNKKFIILDQNNEGSSVKSSTVDNQQIGNSSTINNNQFEQKTFTHKNQKNIKNNQKVSKNKTTLCEICGKFKNANNFKLHLAFHRGIKTFHCKIVVCNKKFTINRDLNDHIRKRHTGERPYHCLVCGKRFLTGSVFYQHRLIHRGERRYGCKICGKCYYRSNTLKYHLKTHVSEKLFQCIT